MKIPKPVLKSIANEAFLAACSLFFAVVGMFGLYHMGINMLSPTTGVWVSYSSITLLVVGLLSVAIFAHILAYVISMATVFIQSVGWLSSSLGQAYNHLRS